MCQGSLASAALSISFFSSALRSCRPESQIREIFLATQDGNQDRSDPPETLLQGLPGLLVAAGGAAGVPAGPEVPTVTTLLKKVSDVDDHGNTTHNQVVQLVSGIISKHSALGLL